MSLFSLHALTFVAIAGVIWLAAGVLIQSVKRIAYRFERSGFSVAFVVLGLLTSISEMSVAVNATIDGVPQVSAGNLIGASLVLLLFVVPLLAFLGQGIRLNHTISRDNLLITLAVIVLPSLFVLDGQLVREEGMLMILAYLGLVWNMKGSSFSTTGVRSQINHHPFPVIDSLKILTGAIVIFIAGHFLVEQAVFFAEFFHVPPSIIGLILLSLGTNVPEIVVAIRSILSRQQEIAFGDYLGSAAANTLIFGFLPLVNGSFKLETEVFLTTSVLTIGGLALCHFFANSRREISRPEGLVLIAMYVGFLFIQTMNALRFAANY